MPAAAVLLYRRNLSCPSTAARRVSPPLACGDGSVLQTKNCWESKTTHPGVRKTDSRLIRTTDRTKTTGCCTYLAHSQRASRGHCQHSLLSTRRRRTTQAERTRRSGGITTSQHDSAAGRCKLARIAFIVALLARRASGMAATLQTPAPPTPSTRTQTILSLIHISEPTRP